MLPYLGFFSNYLIFVFYILDADNHWDGEGSTDDSVPAWFYVLERFWNVLLIIYSLYFLHQEKEQLKKQQWSYFTDVWNYADFVPPIIIILIILVDFFVKDTEEHEGVMKFRYSMQAVASFGMWIKVFYFLRIFRQTGFFVNMLLKVMKSSRTFFLLYILILCAFGCSFFIMAPNGRGFFYNLNYSYLLGLGEFDMEWDEYRVPITTQLFFLAATVLVVIVMLNLLIAIVSTAYEDVITT